MNKSELLKLLELQADLVYSPTAEQTNLTLDYIDKHFSSLMGNKNLSDVFDTDTSIQHLQGIDDNVADLKSDQKLAKDMKASPYNWFHTGSIPVKPAELVHTIIKLTKQARSQAKTENSAKE